MKKLWSLLLIACVFSLFLWSELASVSQIASLGNLTLYTMRDGKYYFRLPAFFPDPQASIRVKAVAENPAQASASLQGQTLAITLTALADLEIEVSGKNFILNRFFLKRELEGLVKQWSANVLWGKYLAAKRAHKERSVLQGFFQSAQEAYQELAAYHPGYAKGALKILAKEDQQFLKGLFAHEKALSPPHLKQAEATSPSKAAPVMTAVLTPEKRESTAEDNRPPRPALTPAKKILTEKTKQADTPFSAEAGVPPKTTPLVLYTLPVSDQKTPGAGIERPTLFASEEMTVFQKAMGDFSTSFKDRQGNGRVLTSFPAQAQELRISFLLQSVWIEFRRWLIHTPLLAFPITLLLFSLLEGVIITLLIFSLLYLTVSKISISAEQWRASIADTAGDELMVGNVTNGAETKYVGNFQLQTLKRLFLPELPFRVQRSMIKERRILKRKVLST